MRRFLTLVYKDTLVLLRDRAGLAMLFLMPASLVLLMTALQDTTFRSLNDSGIRLLLVNRDNDTLGNDICREIVQSKLFSVHTYTGGAAPSEAMAREAVARGEYQMALVIPEGATRQIRENMQRSIMNALAGKPDHDTVPRPVAFALYLEPTTRASHRETLQATIREFSTRVESRLIINELGRQLQHLVMLPDLRLSQPENLQFREEYASLGKNATIPNTVQHNVPAWTVFAMFFIIIPFAGAIIREREDGTLSRLLTLPCTRSGIMAARILVYLVISYLQFILILLMGIHLFPVINLPSLDIGVHFGRLSVVALSTALAAISFGIAIGTIARTHQQASIFASISVVILAALGGIWVPVFIMPPLLRRLSVASPLNWGLNGFYDLLIRGSSLRDILSWCLLLCAFSLACILTALAFGRHTREVR